MDSCYVMVTVLALLLGALSLYTLSLAEQPARTSDWHACRDQDGNPVDLFMLYKLPEDPSSEDSLLQQGLAYMYLIPDSQQSTPRHRNNSNWLLSNRSIGDVNSMAGTTLSSLYQPGDDETLFLVYNDELPNGTTSETRGHTKGVVLLTRGGGYWLVHSVPRYPPAPQAAADGQMDGRTAAGGYAFPTTARRYGQSFLCLSLPPHMADNVGRLLEVNAPFVYAAWVGRGVRGAFPVLESLAGGRLPPAPATSLVLELTTRDGNTVTAFAKTAAYGADLYGALVAPSLRTSLLVESWRNGPGPLPSICTSPYWVQNVQQVRAPGSVFSTHRDHSKWAASNASVAAVVCVGDINRMASQLHRAGGTICMRDPAIWRS